MLCPSMDGPKKLKIEVYCMETLISKHRAAFVILNVGFFLWGTLFTDENTIKLKIP